MRRLKKCLKLLKNMEIKKTQIRGIDFMAYSNGRIFYFKNGDYVELGKRSRSSKRRTAYLSVSIYLGKGKSLTFLSHRIVAMAFIPNPLNKKCVNHKDRNPYNNNVSNLEWVTDKENSLHRHGYEKYILD
jgi:hypothetical protein